MKRYPINQFDDMFVLRSHSTVLYVSRHTVEWMGCESFHIVMKIVIELKFYVRHSSRS